MTDIIDLNVYRARRRPGLLREQLRASLDLPPAPNHGLHRGDFVKLENGVVGWISDQRVVGGKLILCVRANGRGTWVAAENVTTSSGA